MPERAAAVIAPLSTPCNQGAKVEDTLLQPFRIGSGCRDGGTIQSIKVNGGGGIEDGDGTIMRPSKLRRPSWRSSLTRELWQSLAWRGDHSPR